MNYAILKGKGYMIKILQYAVILLLLVTCLCRAAEESRPGPASVKAHTKFEMRALGETSKTDSLITYAAPSEFPFEGEPLFNVKVSGHYTGIYNDINAWSKLVSFGYFDMAAGREVEIEVDYARGFDDYDILPKNNDIISSRHGKTICIKINKPQALTVVFDNDYQGEVLHIFANTIDKDKPEAASEELVYFGPGYHKLDKPLEISGKQKVYIAGGAVVHGLMNITNADGVRVFGRGMLMRAEANNVVLGANYSKNVSLDGILIHNHKRRNWTAAMYAVSNFSVSNVKIVGTGYASTDGFDIINSNGIHFDNVFIRSCDDSISIKGLAAGKPAECPANENMVFENMQLWNDCNNSMCMGAETRAVHYSNITFRNIDVLCSYDDRDHHMELDERSVMTIVCLEGTFFKDIRFENIRVNRCERLICLTFKDSFWFGSIKGDQSTEGGICNVMYKNISSPSNSGSSIANEILLNGWFQEGTPTKYIQDVTFDNVSIEGEDLTDGNKRWMKTNNSENAMLVRDVKFVGAE